MKKSLVLGLDKDQKRKEKPALVAQLTLLVHNRCQWNLYSSVP